MLDFLSHTVTTNMDSLSTSFDTIYFPAITICNMNFMQRSVLEKYDLQVSEPVLVARVGNLNRNPRGIISLKNQKSTPSDSPQTFHSSEPNP